MNQPFKPFSPLDKTVVATIDQPQSKPTFVPISPKKMIETGASSQRVVNLLATFDSPTGILNYGQDVMSAISEKSEKLLEEVNDSDVDFVENQLTNILTLASSIHLKPKAKGSEAGWFTKLVSGVKSHTISVKEQMLAEFNDVSTQMARVIGEVDDANKRILAKIPQLQEQYQNNLKEYQQLDIIIADAKEAKSIKIREYEALKDTVTTPLDAQNAARMLKNIDRLDKKIENLEKFQMMILMDAPDLAQKEDDAVTLLEKFNTIKTLTIPLWSRKMRAYIDGQDINRSAKLASAIDDANNQMILANSNATKDNAIETARLNQRSIVDDQTVEQVHQNLLDTLGEVLTINTEGRIRRAESSNRMDEIKRLYASIGSGQTSIEDARTQSVK